MESADDVAMGEGDKCSGQATTGTLKAEQRAGRTQNRTVRDVVRIEDKGGRKNHSDSEPRDRPAHDFRSGMPSASTILLVAITTRSMIHQMPIPPHVRSFAIPSPVWPR